MTCTVTVFGRSIAAMPKRDADYWRGVVVHDCWCPDCRSARLRTAAAWLDAGANRIAHV